MGRRVWPWRSEAVARLSRCLRAVLPLFLRSLSLRGALRRPPPGTDRRLGQRCLRRARRVKARGIYPRKYEPSNCAFVLSDIGLIMEFHIDLHKTRVSSGQDRRGQTADTRGQRK